MTLTPAQVENWRHALIGQFGVYALIMPVEDIERYRDQVQKQVADDLMEPPKTLTTMPKTPKTAPTQSLGIMADALKKAGLAK